MKFHQYFRISCLQAIVATWVVAALFTAVPAAAQSLGWMKGSAAGFFTDADWRLLRETMIVALDQAQDGEAREWRNEKSRAYGKVTPLFTDTRDEVTCRRVRIESSARGASDSFRYLFCRQGDGPWTLGLPGHGNLTVR